MKHQGLQHIRCGCTAGVDAQQGVMHVDGNTLHPKTHCTQNTPRHPKTPQDTHTSPSPSVSSSESFSDPVPASNSSSSSSLYTSPLACMCAMPVDKGVKHNSVSVMVVWV